jgi:hypothetical protein
MKKYNYTIFFNLLMQITFAQSGIVDVTLTDIGYGNGNLKDVNVIQRLNAYQMEKF